MSVTPVQDYNQTLPPPAGYVVGFVDTQAGCDAITIALIGIGTPKERIVVLHGEDGAELLHRMMEGFLWGEEAEHVMTHGERELGTKHFVICVETKDRDEGLRIAKTGGIARRTGLHSFRRSDR